MATKSKKLKYIIIALLVGIILCTIVIYGQSNLSIMSIAPVMKQITEKITQKYSKENSASSINEKMSDCIFSSSTPKDDKILSSSISSHENCRNHTCICETLVKDTQSAAIKVCLLLDNDNWNLYMQGL